MAVWVCENDYEEQSGMIPTLTHPDVEAAVITAVATALDRKPEEIELGASLQDEYGAESLDILEIVFNIEKACRIRLPKMTLLQHAQEQFGEGQFVKQGELTPLGLQVLRQMRPEIDPDQFHPGLRVQDVGRLVTTQTFVRLVLRLLEGKEEALQRLQTEGCSACGSKDVQDSPTAAEFVCAKCAAIYPAPSGDAILSADLASIQTNRETSASAPLTATNAP
jgi:acyl carrier protein